MSEPTAATLFPLEPFERAEAKGKTDAEVRRVTVHVKKTQYERRLPAKRKTAAPAGATKARKAKKTIAERFEAYHTANPHVYKMLVELALADKRAGMAHSGMQMYIEQVRFRMRRKVKTGEPFKISNDFAAHYARLVMRQEPDLAEFFDVRELKSE